jgi:hypothetical protein
MHGFSGFVLRLTWLATIGLTAPAVGPDRVWAQDTTQPAPQKSVAARPEPARRTRQAAEPRTAPIKSLSQRIFETPWVLFPTRLTVVIVLGAVAALFLAGSIWSTVRLAHLLRHMRWTEPPRRLKRGELGAAGASLGWEFEDRSTRDSAQDAEQDKQIALLQQNMERLTQEQIELAATVAKFLKTSRRGKS